MTPRQLTYLIGPESVLALAGATLFWFCARHGSGEGRDVALMETLIWLLPFLLTPLAFATVLAPGSQTWWWLGRAIVFTYLAILTCGGRLIEGLGSGAKGQDAAFIILLTVGSAAIALGSAVSGAVILAATKPAFASWFQCHKVLGSILVLLSAAPLGLALGMVATFGTALALGFYAGFLKR